MAMSMGGVVIIFVLSSCVMGMMMMMMMGGNGGVQAVKVDPQSTQYVVLKTKTNKVRARCLARNKCYLKKLTCPSQCPKRIGTGKPSCFIDCSAKCQTTCKIRKPKCSGYSAVCYDPRFVGGDGIMFYFHGKSGDDFCLVSDTNLHVNAHFIGVRPTGRTRDFTWIQALGVVFDKNHTFSVAAETLATWTNDEDHLQFTFDGQTVNLDTGAGSKWTSEMGEVEIVRTADTNIVQVTIDGGSMVATIEVVPITSAEDQVHRYELPADNCFAHLNIQFDRFLGLSENVDGVLGQTYRPGFKNPVKIGVPMPIMGGESRFKASSLFSTDCLAAKFHLGADRPSSSVEHLSSVDFGGHCTGSSTNGGIICRR